MKAQPQVNLFDEITVDGFCGGGGWSTGFELAIGEPVTIGINHDADAIAMHKKNHPYTKHFNENIFEVDPRKACAGRPVGWAHFSPDCTHFSKAKGGKPVKKNIRGLAWVIVKWAGTVQPRIISMENVKEFMTWGPLIAARDEKTGRVLKRMQQIDEETGETIEIMVIAAPGEVVPISQQLLVPDKKRAGETFRAFCKAMKELGYEYEFNVLKACDYGAPTSRERLFGIFRRDGKPIVWPEPTHGDPNSEAVKSGRLKPWRVAAEIIDWNQECPSIFDRKKPLAENTLKRIARGIEKFVIENPEPFIVHYKYENEPESIDSPLSTITAVNGHYVVTPTLISYHSETCKGEVRGQSVKEPITTVDASNRYGLVSAMVAEIGYGDPDGHRISSADEKPLGTVVGKEKHAAVTAFLSKYYGGTYKGAGSAADAPLHTITAKDHNAVITTNILQLNNNCVGQSVSEPLRTITAGAGHFAEVQAMLIKFYGQGTGQTVSEPLDTVTAKDRFGLVTIQGVDYMIVDIGLRMLSPRELYAAQGFPPDYEIETDCYGNHYPKSKQVARCGNAVPPPFATAIVRANWPEKCRKKITTMAELNNTIAV